MREKVGLGLVDSMAKSLLIVLLITLFSFSFSLECSAGLLDVMF